MRGKKNHLGWTCRQKFESSDRSRKCRVNGEKRKGRGRKGKTDGEI